MTARTVPQASRSFTSAPRRRLRHGRRHSAKITAADAIRIHATPSTSTRAKSSTAKAGPR